MKLKWYKLLFVKQRRVGSNPSTSAMSKIRVGNKQNSFLNGEWAGHVRGWWKRHTSKRRRSQDKKEIKQTESTGGI